MICMRATRSIRSINYSKSSLAPRARLAFAFHFIKNAISYYFCASAPTFVFCAYAHGICFPLCAFFVFCISARAFKKRASTQPRRLTMRLTHAPTSNRFSAAQLLIFALECPAIVQFSTKFLPKHPPNGLPRMIRRFSFRGRVF